MSDFTALVDLAAARTGGRALFATDDFFAEVGNLLLPGRGVFIEDRYTERGKWMDGWESRRKRGPGHDHAILSLGMAGSIHGLDVDTNHFRGNFPAACSLDALAAPVGVTLERLQAATWTEVLPRTTIEGHTRNLLVVKDRARHTHLRFHIYPDGGVARLRLYGDPAGDQ
jgi:allantoicase